MKLVAFQYGKTEITERMAFQDGDPNKKLPIGLLFFLVETANRRILVDVGCDTMPGFPLSAFRKPVEVLQMYGLQPHDITDVLLTHAHHDHADACRYYSSAAFYMQEKEYLRARRYLPEGATVYTFSDSIPITPRITVKKIGGHTAGSCIALLDTPEDTIVLCGDECYTRENLLLEKPTGSSHCLENSTAFVRQYRQPGFRPILFHDPTLTDGLGFEVLHAEPERNNK